MKSMPKTTAAVLALICAAALAVPAAAQDKPEDLKAIVAEIAGDFDFVMDGQSLLIQFTAREDKLYGAPPGEMPEELKPVAGKPLCFDVTVSTNGEYYFLQFVRGEAGVIDKCLLSVMGMTLEGEGAKIKK